MNQLKIYIFLIEDENLNQKCLKNTPRVLVFIRLVLFSINHKTKINCYSVKT
jgi:hypothetical protein